MKRCFRWSVGLALLALVASFVIPKTEDAKAGLITSALVGVVSTASTTSQVTGNFLIVDKSSGRTVWQAPSSGVTVSEQRTNGTLTFQYNTSSFDTAALSPGGSYEWVFRVDGRNADSSVKFGSFAQVVDGAQYSSNVPSHDLRNRIGDALVVGQFQ